jgi:nucleoside-diphosphate-sugar epimerase
VKALVTGSAGLIGRHMAAELEHRGWVVDGVDLKVGNRDARLFFRQPPATRYDLVVHCAAHVSGRVDIEGRPAYLASVNQQLDGALFEWALRTKPAHIIYWSSSAAYPIGLQQYGSTHRLTETDIDLDHPRLPDASYGAVKIMGERMAHWAEAEGIRTHVFRPFSGWAADQDDTYPMRAFLDRAKRRDDPFTIWGSGEQVRDWIHVSDVIAGVLAAVDQDYPGPLNLCSGEATSFNQLADMVTTQAGYTPTLHHHLDAPAGVAYRVGDPTGMLKVYTPRVTLEQGIKQALA